MMQTENNLTLGSLFDGSGGFPLGGLIFGVTPVWASEVEPFPIMVTSKRLPQMKHIGNISTVSGAEIAPVDIITFGSPCQDMSLAGKREGLDGNRSSLFFEAIRIIKEMREKTNGQYPRYIVWENVPGAFSSNKGEDFKAVLESICSVKASDVSIAKPAKWAGAGHIMGDGYDIAWRTLDAQYWGVPQRRKRIYLVADFTGQCAGKILFESEGLSGYSSQSNSPWKGTATDVIDGIEEASSLEPQMFENHSQDTRYKGPLEVAQTVSATYGTGGNNQPFVVQTPKAYGICAKDSNSMKSSNPHSGFYEANTSRTVDCNGGNPTCNQGGIAVIEGNGTRPSHKGDGYKESDIMYTLNATEQHAVAFAKVHATLSANDGPKGPSSQMMTNPEENFVATPSYGIDRAAYNQGKNAQFGFAVEEEVEPTMVAKGPGAVAVPTYSSSKASFFTSAETELANTLVATDYKDPPLVNDLDDAMEYIVRRLTPTECARLQGFPDWWCSDLGTENPTENDIAFWSEVFETHRLIMGTSTKPKRRNQIIKWLKDPQSDSAEYKMWGNGVALPCVCFVMAGLVYYTQNADQ